MNTLKAFVSTLHTPVKRLNKESIYDISINDLNGNPINFKDFQGKYLMFVNVASKCGFTPQYKDLQLLYDTYKDHLEIIGVPCNQFGNQEPGNASEIETFCQINYGVTFTITEKINVKGKDQHELYSWLTEKLNNGVKSSNVKWNFQKYLVDPKGQLIEYFFSITNPMSSRITKYLK
ncbi:glutathione peroxidase [Seonamhaeicola sediminis]|uniref:Glutathione peroxidase n=1 Tax=Seonamhaeicola sediminis TaxID=2528206 RepID=A0A562YBA2_9FLAO|nr:glutathione peroxidase [Seonamhaeicola sediminis]TWO31687.1 glutathione peroxidase [Seonamhaeicola sediminis]